MDGCWRGPASTVLPSGVKHDVTQTERIGPFLDGSVKVLEGRGYDSEGKVSFNAFRNYFVRSADAKVHASFVCAGKSQAIFRSRLTRDRLRLGDCRRTDDNSLHRDRQRRSVERSRRLHVSGKDPQRFFEMNLKRVSDTKWPADGSSPAEITNYLMFGLYPAAGAHICARSHFPSMAADSSAQRPGL